MLDLLGRTGVHAVQIRYSEDKQPTVWFVVALYRDGRAEAAGALDPGEALERLCCELLDGGTCTHCGRMTGFDLDPDDTVNELVGHGQVCWYIYDPELKTIRRGCEGATR